MTNSIGTPRLLELLTKELEAFAPERRLQVLAVLEQRARSEANLPELRAVQEYRRVNLPPLP